MPIVLVGCSSTITIQDVDTPPMSLVYVEDQAWAKGKTLFIEVNQRPGLNLARITPIVYKGDVYLEQLRISSGGKRKEIFELDLSSCDLPKDWQDKIYWIAGHSYDNLWQVLTHKGQLPQRVKRLKINLKTQQKNPQDSLQSP